MMVIGLAIVISICLINVSKRADRGQKVPTWVKKVIKMVKQFLEYMLYIISFVCVIVCLFPMPMPIPIQFINIVSTQVTKIRSNYVIIYTMYKLGYT